MKPIHLHRTPARFRAAGFTLVEMMVAMSIAMIVLLGLSVTFVNLKSTFNSQDKFAQLQDGERLSLSMLTTSLNEAGYYPNSWSSTRVQDIAATTDATGGTMPGNGYFIYGTAAGAGNSPPETLSTAYASASGDGLLTCQGGSNTTGTSVTIRNTFYVDATTGAFGCAVASDNATMVSAFTPIISNVQSMSVLYGVDTDGDGLVDKYLSPANVASLGATMWLNVKSAQITLNFVNPYVTGSTIQWVHTVNLMNNR